MTDKEKIAALQKKLDNQTLLFIRTNEESKKVLLRAESDLKSQAEQIAAMREALDYFSCPDCNCKWFRTRDHVNDILQCKGCRWEGSRKAGESARFFLSSPSPVHDAKERLIAVVISEYENRFDANGAMRDLQADEREKAIKALIAAQKTEGETKEVPPNAD